jgi:hypothetical protein
MRRLENCILWQLFAHLKEPYAGSWIKSQISQTHMSIHTYTIHMYVYTPYISKPVSNKDISSGFLYILRISATIDRAALDALPPWLTSDGINPKPQLCTRSWRGKMINTKLFSFEKSRPYFISWLLLPAIGSGKKNTKNSLRSPQPPGARRFSRKTRKRAKWPKCDRCPCWTDRGYFLCRIEEGAIVLDQAWVNFEFPIGRFEVFSHK